MSEQTLSEPHLVLDLFADIRKIKDTEIAELLNLHRNSVKKKRKGLLPLNDIEVRLLAKAFDIPPDVMFMSGRAAVSWALEHRPEWFSRKNSGGAPVVEARVIQLARKLEQEVRWPSNSYRTKPTAA